VTEATSGPTGGTVTRHPAFAQLQANRVTGGAMLYGSDFQHQSYVSVKLYPSELHRSLSSDRFSPAGMQPIFEVLLSEAQWAHFVSAMNVGFGTAATLTWRDGVQIPGLPQPPSRAKQFGAELRSKLARAERALKAAGALLAASGLSKAKAKAIQDELDVAARDLGGNAEFVAHQFDEHMQATTEAAKSEVAGYMSGALRAAGLEALRAPGAPALAGPEERP
jgi:hypothetical protein